MENDKLYAKCELVCDDILKMNRENNLHSLALAEYYDDALDKEECGLIFFLDLAEDIEEPENRLSLEITSFANECMYSARLYSDDMLNVNKVYSSAVALIATFLEKQEEIGLTE